MPNGDLELGDFPYRKSPDWVTLNWVVNHQCNVGCPYCVGWKDSTPTVTVIDKLGGTAAVTSRFEKLRDHIGKNVYLIFTGGETTLVPQLSQLAIELGSRGFIMELQTNCTTKEFSDWVTKVPASYIGLISAAYHGWLLDNDETFGNSYFNNFNYAMSLGHTCVLQTIVPPVELPGLPQKLDRLRSRIPSNAPMLPCVYIHNIPTSLQDHAGAYPHAYTAEEKTTLFSLMQSRKTCQKVFFNGGGLFKGMQCDVGHTYAYIDVNGGIFPCYGLGNAQHKIGDLITGQYRFRSDPVTCPYNYCACAYWGMWYGLNPWAYVPGATEEEAYYCKFGPSVEMKK